MNIKKLLFRLAIPLSAAAVVVGIVHAENSVQSTSPSPTPQAQVQNDNSTPKVEASDGDGETADDTAKKVDQENNQDGDKLEQDGQDKSDVGNKASEGQDQETNDDGSGAGK